MQPQAASDFRQLLHPDADDPKYRYDSIFQGEGYFARRRNKEKLRLLQRIDPLLRQMFYEDEEVLFLAGGVQSAGAEALFIGALVVQYLNRTAVVITTHRILLIRVNSKDYPRDLRKQLRYETIINVKRSFLGATMIRLRNKKRIIFSGIHQADTKWLMATVGEMAAQAAASATQPLDNIEDLCPHCHDPVNKRLLQCPYCDGTFKSARRASLLSLLFPGLGDWYLGHKQFAVMEMAGAALVWIGFWLPETGLDEPMATSDPVATLVVAATVFAGMHGLDAWFTGRVARYGIYPHAAPQFATPIEES